MGSISRLSILFLASLLILSGVFLPFDARLQAQAEETPAVLEPEPTLIPTEATTEPATEIPTEAPTVEPTALPVETQPATELPPQSTAIPTTGGSSPAGALTAPTLRQPRNNAVLTDRTPTFSWREVSGARRYFIQLYNQDSFAAAPGSLRYTSPRVNTLTFDLPQTNRLPNGTYYWNVTAIGTNGRISPASVTRQFVVNHPSALTAPVTVNDSYTIISGQTVAAPGILSNDTLNSGTISAVNGSAALTGVQTIYGSVTVATDGSFTYTAVASYLGPDSFTYTLTNGAGSSTATVSLTVGIYPSTEPDQFLVMVGETLQDDLLSTDALGSPEATVVSFGAGALGGTVTSFAAPSSQPLAGGTLTVNADGTFSLTDTTTEGNYIFQYRVSNALGFSDGTVVIDVCSETSNFSPCDDLDSDGLKDAWEQNHFGDLDETASGDTDTDNCNHACEYTAGTNPKDNDSDNDGLKDGYEVHTTYTNHDSNLPNTTDPHDSDTDGEGLTDGEEVNGFVYVYSGVEYTGYGNPLMVDTDNDGLNDYEESTVTVSDPNTTDIDGDGLSDSDEIIGTWGYVTDPTREDTDGDRYSDWIEILNNSDPTDSDSKPTSQDADGDGLYDPWEFQFYGNLSTNRNSDTDADSCTNYCESVNGTNPTDNDTDNDGLTDGQEIYLSRSNPTDVDTDNDGLSDGDEVMIYNTSPTLADTDGDTFLDYTEVTKGSDPLNAASIPSP